MSQLEAAAAAYAAGKGKIEAHDGLAADLAESRKKAGLLEARLGVAESKAEVLQAQVGPTSRAASGGARGLGQAQAGRGSAEGVGGEGSSRGQASWEVQEPRHGRGDSLASGRPGP